MANTKSPIFLNPNGNGGMSYSVYYTYNVPHVGPFGVIEMNDVWVAMGVPLNSWFYNLLLDPVHLRMQEVKWEEIYKHISSIAVFTLATIT